MTPRKFVCCVKVIKSFLAIDLSHMRTAGILSSPEVARLSH